MRFNSDDIESLNDRYRAHFINALSGFKSANLIATCDDLKNTNLAIFTSVFHLGANPPLLGMIIRPHSVARHTLENILQTGHYTVNHVNTAIYKQAHQTSARYDKEISEFRATGLTEQWHAPFAAPFVAESRIQLGMSLREHKQLDINNTVLVIGEIVLINIKDDVVQEDGHVDIEHCESIAVSGLESYHGTALLTRLPYAKAEK